MSYSINKLTKATICGILWKEKEKTMAKRKKIEYKSIRAKNSTHEQLVRISEETKIPILALIEIAVPMLKEKYGIKE